MSAKLDVKATELLQLVVSFDGWYVCAENVVAAGKVVEAGYATAFDDYEGPQLTPTDKGAAAALRFGLVRRATAEERLSPYQKEFVRIALVTPFLLENEMSETQIPRSDDTKVAFVQLAWVLGDTNPASSRVAEAIEALIDEKIADAIEAMADKVEAATGNRP